VASTEQSIAVSLLQRLMKVYQYLCCDDVWLVAYGKSFTDDTCRSCTASSPILMKPKPEFYGFVDGFNIESTCRNLAALCSSLCSLQFCNDLTMMFNNYLLFYDD